MTGMQTIPAAREKMVAGWTWIPVESLFFFSSLLLGCYSYLFGATVSLLVRLTPCFFFFFLEGTSGEWA